MHLSYRQQWAIVGAIVGAVVGAVLALMLTEDEGESSIGWSDLAQLASTLSALVQQVHELTGPGER